MKVAYVTRYDARDKGNWSGLGYYIAHALEQQSHALEYVGPLNMSDQWRLWAKRQMYAHLQRKRFLPDRQWSVVRGFGQQASRNLSRREVDVVFSPGTLPVAQLESEQPIVVWTDSTFAAMVDFYPEFTNLCQETLHDGNATEKAALDRAALLIYSSDWAAQTAMQLYGIAQAKVHVVPFGANIENTPSLELVGRIIAARSKKVCTLLFFGATWFRKGGDIAVEVARELNASGLPTELVVVGVRPPLPARTPSFVRYYGKIGKSSPTRLTQINALMAKSHFLILPSRADCTPVVFSEANAFGVPCVATRVGGIQSIIRDGVNGATFDLNADVSSYCNYIWTHFTDPQRYHDLALSAFNEHETRLNWAVAGRAVSELLANVKS